MRDAAQAKTSGVRLRASKSMAHAKAKLAHREVAEAVACKLSPWGVWSPCSKTCGGGQKERVRHVIELAKYGGKACSSTHITATCMTFKCPPKAKAAEHKADMTERCKTAQQPQWCMPNLPPKDDGSPNKNCKAWRTQCTCTCADPSDSSRSKALK